YRAMFSPAASDVWPAPLRPIAALGRLSIDIVLALGQFARFLIHALAFLVVPPFKLGRLIDRIHFIGYRSLTIVILTGAFTGMVLGLQIFLVLSRFGSEAYLAPAVALSLIRYLVVPALVAGVITFPLMVSIFDVVGIFGGYLVGVELLGLSPGTYFGEMKTFVTWSDLMTGYWKALSFGIIVPWVCTYKGFYCGHGAAGVARATTQAVVLSSVLILVWDYFLGSVLP